MWEGLPSFQPNVQTYKSDVRPKNWHQMWNKVKANLMEMMSDVKMAEGWGVGVVGALACQETAVLS